MQLLKCPRCGNMYSPSYPYCPFCAEEEPTKKSRKAAQHRTAHRTSERRPSHSVRGPLIALLVLVLALLSFYFWGDRLFGRSDAKDKNNDTGKQTELHEQTPVTQPEKTPPVDTGKKDDTPPAVDPPATQPDTTQPGADTPPVEQPPAQTVDVPDVSKAKLNREDFSLNVGEKFQVKLSGTTAEVSAWSTDDPTIASVSDTGVVKGLQKGDTKLRATVGDRELTCIVRIKGTGTANPDDDTPTTPETPAVAPENASFKKGDFTLKVGEKYQVKILVGGKELDSSIPVTWSIKNPDVASISSTGVVTAKSTGGGKRAHTTFTATFNGGSLTGDVYVTEK